MPDKTITQEQLKRAALRHWPALAKQAGLEEHLERVEVLHSRHDASSPRIVLKLSGSTGPVALKCKLEARKQKKFPAEIAANRRAAEKMADNSDYRVPHILAVQDGAVLLEYAEASNVYHLIRQKPRAEHLPIIERAGAWLDQFHRTGAIEERVFRTKFFINNIKDLVSLTSEGLSSIPMPEQFLNIARKHIRQGRQMDEVDCLTGELHGDFHLRNLLIGNAVWGVDLLPVNAGPFERDIALFLVRYGALSASYDEIPDGAAVPADITEAFFSGYRLTLPDSPVLAFFLRHRALMDWAKLVSSGDKSKMASDPVLSLTQIERLSGLRAMAARLFAKA
ncbi:phosphotransferase [Palleronia caenipelagi]|nr:phosphotransferase [Palleronia caenipelagi]